MSKEENNMTEEKEKTTRRSFVVKAATAALGVGAAACAIPLIRSMLPDAGVIAAGSTEVDLSNIKEGESITVMWQGKPIFITHRTAEQIKEAQDVSLSELKDPQPDSDRVQKGKEQWLITVAVCTHLGCVPTVGKGEFGGSLCPCHGSQYDTSQRIRKGPAPKNLEVPSYIFLSDTKIKIG